LALDSGAMGMTRREFLAAAAGVATLAGGASACGGDEGDEGGELCTDDPDVEIVGNHGHELVVPIAHVEAGTERTYHIQGNADHDHELTLTSDDFAKLRDTGQLGVNISVPHDHTIRLTC
jgi:hypothetical protein